MAIRFTDDLLKNTDSNDFIVRRRIPLGIQILLIFAIAFVAIYVTAAVMHDTGKQTLFFVTLCITIGSLAWFTVYFSARLRDLVLATEFQNAMLASAAQLSTRFCLITKRDGSIVYVDPGFQKVFPHFMQNSERNLEALFQSVGLSQDVIQKILMMLQENQSDRALLPLRDSKDELLPIMLSVDVLPRPKGYFLLRGRDYVEKRSAESAGASTVVADIPLLHAFNALPQGILIADGTGSIIFINRILEEWLGFASGEMLTRPFRAGQVIYQYAGMDAGRAVNADFDGEVILQRKDRSLITMHIKQASLGKSAGISAIISYIDLK